MHDRRKCQTEKARISHSLAYNVRHGKKFSINRVYVDRLCVNV